MKDAPPLTPDEIAVLWTTWFGGDLPEVCRTGVAQNVALLADHGATVAAALRSMAVGA